MKIKCLAILFLIWSCQSGIHTLSKREMVRSAESYDLSLVHPNKDKALQMGNEIFIKEATPKLESHQNPYETGSLFSPEHSKNNLYRTYPNYLPGDYISVKVVSNRKAVAAKNETGSNKNDEQKKNNEEAKDEEVEKLLNSLPNLKPVNPETFPLKSIRMKVVHKLANGDIIVETHRESSIENEKSLIAVKAKIPYAKLSDVKGITTEDLFDIDWQELRGGEHTERKSIAWDDEFTLRLSGFNEVNSMWAKELDEKQKYLDQIRGEVEKKIMSFGEEKKQFVAERQKLLEERKNMTAALGEAKSEERSTPTKTIEAMKEKVTEEVDRVKSDAKDIKKTIGK